MLPHSQGLLSTRTRAVALAIIATGLSWRLFAQSSIAATPTPHADRGINAAGDDEQLAFADEQLRLTQRIGNPMDGEQERPSQAATIGDNLAWYLVHPKVTNIFVGRVLAATPELRHDTFVVTRCRVAVLESIKGDSAAEIEFLSAGGEAGGVASYASHLPRCVVGETVVALVGWEDSERILVGTSDYYAVMLEVDGRERPWGYRLAAYLRQGRPQ